MGRLINWFKGVKSPCKACLGTGIKAIEVPKSDELVTCPKCLGEGYLKKEVSLTYKNNAPKVSISEHEGDLILGKASSGEGRLVKETWEREFLCNFCKGKKQVQAKKVLSDIDLVCSNCHGTGQTFSKKKLSLIVTLILLSLLIPYVVMVLLSLWAFGFGLWVAFRETYLKKETKNEL